MKFVLDLCFLFQDLIDYYHFGQAGIVASLDTLVKEFVAATGEEKTAIFSKIEEEVGKLEGSSAR